MRKFASLLITGAFSLGLCCSIASADILCVQAKLRAGKVKLTHTLVSTDGCPKGFSEVLDTDDLREIIGQTVGPQGPPGVNGSPDTPQQVLGKLLQVGCRTAGKNHLSSPVQNIDTGIDSRSRLRQRSKSCSFAC